MTTWQRGREIVTANRTAEEGPLRQFVDHIHGLDPPLYRCPGTGVFLNANKQTTPLALRANVEHNHTLHHCVVIVSIETMKVPHVPESERLVIDDLGYADDGITHVVGRFGFQDPTDVPALLRQAAGHGLEGKVDLRNPSYFLSRISIVKTGEPSMSRWRKKLFLAISRNAANPVEYFKLPDERTVVMGSHIEL
jgi:KUP system potassium uptake protein